MAALAASAAGAAARTAGAAAVLSIANEAAAEKEQDDRQNNQNDNRCHGMFSFPENGARLFGAVLDLQLFAFLIRTNQQVDQHAEHHHGRHGVKTESGLAAEQPAELIDDQADGVGKAALPADGRPRPLGVVHLALDGTDGREAGCAEQVENQEAVSGELGELRRDVDQTGEIARVNHLQRVARNREQRAERTDDFFLRNQTEQGRDRRLPVAEAEGLKDEADCVADVRKDGGVHILHHAEHAVHKAEGAGEPDEHGRQGDDRAGLLDEAPAALPRAAQHVLHGRQMIRRELHDERGGLAREGLGLLEDDAGDDDGRNADEVGTRRDPPRAAEDRARHQGNDRHLRAAGDEGRGHNRHAAVTFLLDGAGGHDAGHAAARADQHRDEALAGEAEAAEDAIHDERDARHIAAILQNAQQQEQHEHLRHEAEHRADAADDAVHDQAGEPVGAADALKEADKIAYHELSVPAGGEFQYVLPDGTKVWLNSKSNLRFPENFDKEGRHVYLKGEAFFDVTKDTRNPFTVTTSGGDIRVYGTRFNVTDYDQEDFSAVLVSGSIEYQSPHGKSVRLRPSQRVVYHTQYDHIDVQEVDTLIYTSWINHQFIFKGETLENIMNTLSRWYDFTPVFQSDEIRHIRLSGRLNRQEDIRILLQSYEASTGIKFRINQKEIIITQ